MAKTLDEVWKRVLGGDVDDELEEEAMSALKHKCKHHKHNHGKTYEGKYRELKGDLNE